jgi:hypothetical protein
VFDGHREAVMASLHWAYLMGALFLSAEAIAQDACPVTLSAVRAFAEPSPSTAARFWYGSERLAVLLKAGGTWQGLGRQQRFREKLFWWRRGFSGETESWPDLLVSGRKLDGRGTAKVSRASNAFHSDFGGWAMVTVVEFPSSGCWEVSGDYRGERLRFVVQVVR